MALLRALSACAAACAAALGAFLTLGAGDPPAAALTVDRVVAPLAFEPNAGRFRGGSDFVAPDSGATLAVGPTGSRVVVAGGALTTRLVGATAPRAHAEDRLPTRVNWYASSDRSRWRTGLPTFGRVRYSGVYPGVDLVYHGRRGALEYDFVVAAGADPSRLAMRLAGARTLRLAENGDLVARLGDGIVRQRRPLAWQEVDGDRRPVPAEFVLDADRLSFRLGAYDPSRKLVIDPVLGFQDYVGSTGSDEAHDVTADSAGNVFVGGKTTSPSIPGTSGSSPGGNVGFVLKIAPDGSRPFITYLGEQVKGVAVNPAGGVSATGRTGTTPSDAFAARLNPDGSSQWFATLGGTGWDGGEAVAADGSGNTYIVGDTDSTSGIATVGQTTKSSGYDGYLAKYSASGSKLFATYVGGNSTDQLNGVGITPGCSSSCAVFVGGYTYAPAMASPWSFPSALGGVVDAFMIKVNAGGTGQHWATNGTDSGSDLAYALAMTPAGDAALAGASGTQAMIRTYRNSDGFIKDPIRTYGGPGSETGYDLAFDSQGNVYLTGETTSSSGLDTTGGVQKDYGGGAGDAFAVKWRVNPNSNIPIWSTYLGGVDSDLASGIFVTAEGSALVVGRSSSNNFPQAPATNGSSTAPDGFIVRLQIHPAIIDSGPSGTLRSRTADFTYSSPEPGATFICRLAPIEAGFSACPNGGKSFSGLGDGNYSFEVAPVDPAGTPGAVVTRDFTVDTKPFASLVASPNPVLVGRPVTFDASSSAVADPPITKFEWDLDGDGAFETDTGTTATTGAVYAAPKTIQVGLRITDGAGAQGTTATELRVTTQPGVTQFGVTVNKGAQYTKDADVTVSAVFPATTTAMLLSNDGGFLAPTRFLPAPSVKWKLDSSGPERLPKTIYVRFLAGAIVGETFQDDIILDETPPVVQQAVVAPAAAAAGRVAASSRLRKWKLRVRARDSNSGVARIQATSNKRKPGKLHRYKRRLTVRSAKRPRWIRARDRAGNYSKWRRAR